MLDATEQPSTVAVLRKAREEIYTSGKAFGDDDRQVELWPSGLTADAGEALARLVAAERAARSIETGFALGLSASFIIEGMLASHPPDSVAHVAIDPFQREWWGNAGIRIAARLGIRSAIRLVEEDSLLALPAMIADGQRFDFGFVDGSHLFEHAFCDTLHMTRLVRPGGLIVLDDFWMPAVKAVVGFFTRNAGLTHENPSDSGPTRRFAILRLPTKPIERKWDQFIAF